MKKQQKEKGFTIIEVVLVLAIAALIFLMVFIALPALQRSQRDTQRKNDLSRMTSAITSYQSNNRGDLPGNWSTFVDNYVTTGGDKFVDPSGKPYDVTTVKALPTQFDDSNPIILVTTGAICQGESPIKTDSNGNTVGARKVAIQMKLEGSGTVCQDNN
ncbi:MAG: type II secretion system protein [Candidatus Saccharibacteria bacterium]|nr:type II secretion system protein [Candidatus Saccharibacteria bacterium]